MRTIIHVIDSLGTGGAETLLVNANIRLSGFRHIIVYLRPPLDYVEQLRGVHIYCLNFNGWQSMPRCVPALRRFIKENNAELIHSHLYYSTIIARSACPRNTKLVSTYHNVLYDSRGSNYSVLYRWIDRLTYQSRFITLSVSEVVRNDLEKHIGIKKNSFVLYNYVEENFFNRNRLHDSNTIRIISVGNLKPQKNYRWALEALSPWLKDNSNIVWEIFGDGPERTVLEEIIRRNGIDNVQLKGKVKNVEDVIMHYKLFFMPSQWEGFGIALAEAMAAGLPCLASELPVFKEIAGNTILYFELNDGESLRKQMNWAIEHPSELENLGDGAFQRAQAFTKHNYCQQLRSVYEC